MKSGEGIDEQRLWELCRNGDKQAHDTLVELYSPLVKYVVGRIMVSTSPSVEFDDLVSFGIFGLLDAIKKFDPEKNVKFKTYAVTRIRGAIFDELRAIDWVPRSVRQRAKDVDAAISKIEFKKGRSATDDEIASELGVSGAQLSKTLLEISSTSLLSLNKTRHVSDSSDDVYLIDSLESPESEEPDFQVEREEIRKFIAKEIKELPEKEKIVLVLYYYEELTLKEIGKILGVTESRVSQLHTKAVSRLRAHLLSLKRGLF